MRALQNLEAVKLDLKTTRDLADKMGVKAPEASTQIEGPDVSPPQKRIKVF